jgi:hypothetical protein
MKIDERIEEHVREAFSAAIGRDGDRLVAALDGLDERDSQTALALGLAVCEFVLNDAFGAEPTPAELSTEAEEMRGDLPELLSLDSREQIAAFLGTVARGDTAMAGLDAARIVWLTFVCGGYLLGTRSLDDQKWWEYLNEIWDSLGDTADQ